MMEQSALANDLKAVFHGLKDMEGGGPGSEDPARPQLLEVAVNGWIRISLPGGRGPSASRVAGVGGGGGGLPPRIERYHTILLLLDEDECVWWCFCFMCTQDAAAVEGWFNHWAPRGC